MAECTVRFLAVSSELAHPWTLLLERPLCRRRVLTTPLLLLRLHYVCTHIVASHSSHRIRCVRWRSAKPFWSSFRVIERACIAFRTPFRSVKEVTDGFLRLRPITTWTTWAARLLIESLGLLVTFHTFLSKLFILII